MAASRNTVTMVALIKLSIFVLVSIIVTGTLTAIMGSVRLRHPERVQGDLHLGQPGEEG